MKTIQINQSISGPKEYDMIEMVSEDIYVHKGNPKRWDTTKLGIAQNQAATWDLCYGNHQTIKFASEENQDPTHYITQEEYPLIYQDLIDHMTIICSDYEDCTFVQAGTAYPFRLVRGEEQNDGEFSFYSGSFTLIISGAQYFSDGQTSTIYSM